MKPKKLDLALRFAEMGAKILPEGRNKVPKFKEWPNQATDNPEQIRKWAKMWPTCNFSALTGKRSGFFAIDIDIKNASHGEESWRKLKETAQTTGVKTLVVRTGSGGHHVYLKMPDFDVPTLQELNGYSGIEIKGEKGKVTLPGSTYADGREYAVEHINDWKIAACPEWIAKAIQTAQKVHRATPPPGADEIEPGKRNDSLYRMACSWRASGMEAPGILAGLLEVNRGLSEPLPEEEVSKIAESAATKPKGKKRRKAPAAVDLTDVANAERFYKEYAGRVKYCTILKSWLYWNGAVWRVDDNQVVAGWAKRTAKKIFERAWALDSAELAKKAIACKSRARIDAMLELAKSEEGIPIRPNELDTDPWLWNCANGTMDLREVGVLREPDKAQLITQISPVPFDDDARCPRWDDFLLEIMAGREEEVAFLQRFFGYAMSGDMSERKYLTLYGSGLNGKSVLLEVVAGLFGDYAGTALRDTFLRKKNEGIQHDIARLRSKRLVCVAETPEGSYLDEQLVKQWTGEDTLAGRFFYSQAFDFRPVGKLVIRTNYRPQIKGHDVGIWSRSLFVEFPERFEGDRQDKGLKDKLLAELPGILRWCLVGVAEWRSKGLAPPAKVLEDGAEYREQSDELGDFFAEYLVRDSAARIDNERLYTLYLAYCEKVGNRKPWNRNWLGRKMSERGYKRERDSEGRWWSGLGER